MSSRLAAALPIAALLLLASAARGEILITEVIPNVTTTATRGDVVELFNSGPGAVDLSDWVLTDLDDDPVAGVPQDATFAPGGLAVPALQPGEFAVIDFVDASGTASWRATNYGVRIVAPLEVGSFLGSERDELLLLDAAAAPIDAVAWADGGTPVAADSYEDLSALTGAIFDYGLTPGDAAWDGAETIASDAEYYASAVDFAAFAAVSTWGGGALRRRSTNGVFATGSPDGAAQWEAVPRHQATLGNASDDVPVGMGLRPIRVTDDLADWLGQIETTTFPDRRIARFADQNDFVAAGAPEKADFEALLTLAMGESWEAAFAAAVPLGYEVVELLDTVTGETFHLLRERFVPGEVGFTGRGVFVFFSGSGVRAGLVIEIPHPVFDGDTLEEGALALSDVRPRVLLIAGTHRNNHLGETTCDGSFDGGAKFRISDVAHHPDNFFHTAHVWLDSNLPGMRAVQLHGFCCPGVAPYGDLADDCVISNGFDAVPGVSDFGRLWGQRIEAQSFFADGVDLSTVAVFGEDTAHLGATDNLQGRVTNGVSPGMECNSDAVAASARFFHLEQDPDVREEPQHVLDALKEALDLAAAVETPCAATPAAGCRSAGKSLALLLEKGSADRFVWKWLKGDDTDPADFLDPVGGAAVYHVCLYDASLAPQPLLDVGASAGGTCGGVPCWRALGSKGFGYKDKAGGDDGLALMKLKSGPTGKAKVLVKATGAGLAVPLLPLATPVVVQLLADDGMNTQCWQSTFSAVPQKNDNATFKAKQ